MQGFGALFVSILCVGILLLSPACASASDKLPPPVIAIIDVQRILQESLAAKSSQKKLEVQRSKFQNEIEGEENELRQAEQSLAKERDKLPAQAYADREQQLRQRFTTVENHVQTRRKALDQAFTDSMDSVHNALLSAVDKIAHERGANIVIIKQQALWTDAAMDITDEALKRLDQTLPKIDVVMPVEKSAK